MSETSTKCYALGTMSPEELAMARASLGTLENCRFSQPGLADWKAWANSSSRSVGCSSVKNILELTSEKEHADAARKFRRGAWDSPRGLESLWRDAGDHRRL